jgi:hypothetical protein
MFVQQAERSRAQRCAPCLFFGPQGSHPPTETTTQSIACYTANSFGTVAFVKW